MSDIFSYNLHKFKDEFNIPEKLYFKNFIWKEQLIKHIKF
jgi:hypothetical protein